MVPKAVTRPGPQFGARLIVAHQPERNDTRRGGNKRPHGHFSRRPEAVADDWIWGWHAVEAALSNPRRGPAELILATPERIKQIEARFGRLPTVQQADNQQIAQLSQQLKATEDLIGQINEQLRYSEALIDVNGKLLGTGDAKIADYILALSSYLNAKNLLTQNNITRLQIINQINYWNR